MFKRQEAAFAVRQTVSRDWVVVSRTGRLGGATRDIARRFFCPGSVEIGQYHDLVRVPRRVFQRLLLERPTPERCVEAYHLQRTRFERIAERKLRRRQLSQDGNVEINGRDLREGSTPAPWST